MKYLFPNQVSMILHEYSLIGAISIKLLFLDDHNDP